MYEKHKYGAKDGNFEKYDDQVRLVWDSTGKGVADKSTVFANGFNKLVLVNPGNTSIKNIDVRWNLK